MIGLLWVSWNTLALSKMSVTGNEDAQSVVIRRMFVFVGCFRAGSGLYDADASASVHNTFVCNRRRDWSGELDG
ncbi:hypothetical protein TRL7639_00076 [Falsiruegeria litorea R37]|uniref:Uncharacterized protein n=1 Tax=Falsiruegeria litorea R37 TaxID=1200284 RepID=A0A1Y5R8B0_9RHOB|nr:hypothetical protein TRL7639_00076 [Falsiruegeria litorea R37]